MLMTYFWLGYGVKTEVGSVNFRVWLKLVCSTNELIYIKKNLDVRRLNTKEVGGC